MGTRTPETDVPADGTPGQPSEVILSALDIRRSPASEVSQPNADASPAIQNDRDYSPDLNEAINTPLGESTLFSAVRHTDSLSGTSIDQSNDTSTSRPRRSPPPPPPSRRTLQPGSSRILSETTSNADSLRRAPSVRRPAAPTPIQMMQSLRQSGIYLSPITPNTTSLPPSSPQGAPTPAMISSIDSLAQQLTSLASSITKEAHKQQRLGRSASTRTNCVEITGSTVEGLTMNNNAHNCSGAGASCCLLCRCPPHVSDCRTRYECSHSQDGVAVSTPATTPPTGVDSHLAVFGCSLSTDLRENPLYSTCNDVSQCCINKFPNVT